MKVRADKSTLPLTSAQQVDIMSRLTQGAVAWLLGVSPRTIRDYTDIPSFNAAGKGKKGSLYNARDVAKWRIEREAANNSDTGDPLLSGGSDSPALERYRDEKAKLAKMERMRQEGSLLPADAVLEAYSAFGKTMKRFADDLQRRFGDEPYQLYIDRLNQAERAVKRVLGVGVESKAKRP